MQQTIFFNTIYRRWMTVGLVMGVKSICDYFYQQILMWLISCSLISTIYIKLHEVEISIGQLFLNSLDLIFHFIDIWLFTLNFENWSILWKRLNFVLEKDSWIFGILIFEVLLLYWIFVFTLLNVCLNSNNGRCCISLCSNVVLPPSRHT